MNRFYVTFDICRFPRGQIARIVRRRVQRERGLC